ncbi:MAG TPA: substrate-binding domain-containing protein, partial [Phycisphaeraceae bacterium]
VLARGRSRIAVIMGETWRVGDNRFYEGIRLGMSEAGLPADGLRVVSLPPDRNAIKRYVSSCLAEADGPTAFISKPGRVGSDLWVPQVIADAVAEAGLQVPRDISVVYHLDRDRSSGQFPVFPCTYRTWTWVQTFDCVADLLAAAMHDGPDAPREHVLLPVAMYEPTSA